MRRIDFKSGLDMAEDFYAALEFSPGKNVEVDVVSASADPYSVVATSDLDDVAARLAAARAEAVAEHVRQQDEEAQRESDEDELVWDEIKATPIEQIESELRDAGCDTDNLTKQTRMVVRLSLERNKAVREKAEAVNALQQLVEAMPKCHTHGCNSTATALIGWSLFCDAHRGDHVEQPHAAPLRLAIKLLAAGHAEALEDAAKDNRWRDVACELSRQMFDRFGKEFPPVSGCDLCPGGSLYCPFCMLRRIGQ